MNPPLPPNAPPPPPPPPFTPAPEPAPKKKNWLLIGCGGCLSAIIVGGVVVTALFFFVLSVIKKTDAYQSAVSTAANSPEVQAELGTPITPGFLPTGNVNSSNNNGVSTGTADFSVPLKGPKGTGKLHYSATKNGDTWQVNAFTVTIDGSDKTIIVAPAAGSEPALPAPSSPPESAPVAPPQQAPPPKQVTPEAAPPVKPAPESTTPPKPESERPTPEPRGGLFRGTPEKSGQ